ncbi:MAG: hypothetical protein QF767_19060, partial [Alphaproteobacteria bacterium]|nr:hypothetical protein [Alphaproteobacteria bacterium]
AIYFALAKIGAIMVPINFWHKSQEIHYTLEQSGCSALIADGSFAEVTTPIQQHFHALGWTLYYGTRPEREGLYLDDAIAAAPAS